jgi:hypothetical protein
LAGNKSDSLAKFERVLEIQPFEVGCFQTEESYHAPNSLRMSLAVSSASLSSFFRSLVDLGEEIVRFDVFCPQKGGEVLSQPRDIYTERLDILQAVWNEAIVRLASSGLWRLRREHQPFQLLGVLHDPVYF